MHIRRKIVSLGLRWIASLLLAGLPAFAVAPPAALAAPAAPQNGAFVVNGIGDNTDANSFLTLREAILISRGGTDSNGINRALTVEEKGQLSGCSYYGPSDLLIFGGCGGGITDTITFAGSLTGDTIVLAGGLPPIQDTAATIIDGTDVIPTIDASALVGLYQGLEIQTDDNVVRHLKIEFSPFNAILIDGNGADNNTIFDVWAWDSESGDGITIDSGDGNVLNQVYVGVSGPDALSCGTGASNKGNFNKGIVIIDGAANNTVKNSIIGCNGYVGVWIQGATSSNNTIGPNNAIGTNQAGTGNLGNLNNGIDVYGDFADEVPGTSILDNTIAFNDSNGINVQNCIGTKIGGNHIHNNDGSGVAIFADSEDTIVGGPSAGNSLTGNLISDNALSGIWLSQGAHHNLVVGNLIGTSASGLAVDANGGDGVRIEIDAHHNDIGVSGGAPNVIAGGGVARSGVAGVTGAAGTAGVAIVSGSHHNQVANNYIGTDLGADLSLPNAVGIFIEDANDNEIGGASFGEANRIYYSQAEGIHLTGSGSFDNLIRASFVFSSGAQGILVNGGAHDNELGDPSFVNAVYYNAESGIAILGSSTSTNTLSGNLVSQNMMNGLRLGAGAHDNTVERGGAGLTNLFSDNLANGILIIGGATDNVIDDAIATGNGRNGVELSGAGTTRNVISATVSFSNTLDGLNERDDAAGNLWTHLTTRTNGGLGIDRDAPDDAGNTPTGPFPVINRAYVSGANTLFMGTASLPLALQTITIEIYRVAYDPSGYGEGLEYVASALVGPTGQWATILLGQSQPRCYTAFEVKRSLAGFSSSEYSLGTCRLTLPFLTR